MRAPLPRRDWRKTVTASQGVAPVIAAAGVAPSWVSRVLLAVALAMLVESFGRDVWWLRRHPAGIRAVDSRRSTAFLVMVAIVVPVATAVVRMFAAAFERPFLWQSRRAGFRQASVA